MDTVRAALADRYTVDREIGRGGMSTVYLARDLRHSRVVAIKVLDPGLAFTIGPDRFRREIATLARLHHPNILPLLDSGALPHGQSLYYIMPFVTGESLRSRLDRERQLSVEDTVRLTAEIADALDYAHGNDVVHRDIKPENILLQSGHAVLADFGIARAPDPEGSPTLSTVGLAVGTPQYMSPEQAQGRTDVDGRSDQYSLACVVFEMLAGTPPFEGNSALTVAARHTSELPPSLRRVRATIPRSLESAIERALSKVPADRFSKTGQFAAALTAGALNEGGLSLPSWRRMGEDARHHWGVLLGIGALLVAVLALFWSRGGDGRRLETARPDWVVGYPLAELGERDTILRTGESIAGMLSEAMQQVPALRWIDGWSLLDPAARQDARTLDVTKMRKLTRAQGARYAIHGAFVTTRDSVTVDLRLLDVVRDSQVGQASASDARATAVPVRLGLRALLRLLPAVVAPGARLSEDALASVASGDAAAVALWMQGDAAYRRSRYSRALELYREAVSRDSTLALAAFKGAQAAIWAGSDTDAVRLSALALRHDQHLPQRYVDYARGLRAYLAGSSDSAVAALRAALTPDAVWAEGWALLGEVYFHQFPRTVAPLDTLAESAFTAALDADSGFAPALPHLIEFRLGRGELASAGRLLDRYRSSGADRESWFPLDLGLRCLQSGADRFDWKKAAAVDPDDVLLAAKLLSVGARQSGCARRAAESLVDAEPDNASPALTLLLGLDAAQGRTPRVIQRQDSLFSRGNTGAIEYAILGQVAGLARSDTALAVLAKLRLRGQAAPEFWHWWIAEDAMARGDLAAEQRLRSDRAFNVANDSALMLTLDARMALLLGDSTAAIDLLQRSLALPAAENLDWSLQAPRPIERLLLARLLLARSRPDDALVMAAAFDGQPMAFLPFLPASLELRATALDQLSRPDAARRVRRRLEVLRGP